MYEKRALSESRFFETGGGQNASIWASPGAYHSSCGRPKMIKNTLLEPLTSPSLIVTQNELQKGAQNTKKAVWRYTLCQKQGLLMKKCTASTSKGFSHPRESGLLSMFCILFLRMFKNVVKNVFKNALTNVF